MRERKGHQDCNPVVEPRGFPERIFVTRSSPLRTISQHLQGQCVPSGSMTGSNRGRCSGRWPRLRSGRTAPATRRRHRALWSRLFELGYRPFECLVDPDVGRDGARARSRHRTLYPAQPPPPAAFRRCLPILSAAIALDAEIHGKYWRHVVVRKSPACFARRVRVLHPGTDRQRPGVFLHPLHQT